VDLRLTSLKSSGTELVAKPYITKTSKPIKATTNTLKKPITPQLAPQEPDHLLLGNSSDFTNNTLLFRVGSPPASHRLNVEEPDRSNLKI
jgi:hypothetical protein